MRRELRAASERRPIERLYLGFDPDPSIVIEDSDGHDSDASSYQGSNDEDNDDEDEITTIMLSDGENTAEVDQDHPESDESEEPDEETKPSPPKRHRQSPQVPKASSFKKLSQAFEVSPSKRVSHFPQNFIASDDEDAATSWWDNASASKPIAGKLSAPIVSSDKGAPPDPLNHRLSNPVSRPQQKRRRSSLPAIESPTKKPKRTTGDLNILSTVDGYAEDEEYDIVSVDENDEENDEEVDADVVVDEEEDEDENEMNIDSVPAKPRVSVKGGRGARVFTEPKVVTDKVRYHNGVEEELKPIKNVQDALYDLYENANKHGLGSCVDTIQSRPLRVATMCSGTESPILVMQKIQQFVQNEGKDFKIDHVFSAELVPFKQAYINLNFDVSILFRDITELLDLAEQWQKNEKTKQPELIRGEMDSEVVKGVFEMTNAYGAKVIVPGSLDLLVLGTCCVDFSHLNAARKALKEGGESGDTFFASIQYLRVYRPKIVIFENVASAPWGDKKTNKGNTLEMDLGMADELHKIDYDTVLLKLDTKDYYLPQTRNRGYMLCIDTRGKNEEERETIRAQLRDYENLVEAFKRPVSSPADTWVFEEDDQRLLQEHSTFGADVDKVKKAVAWERCKVGYDSYRHDLALGPSHPITQWEAGGHFVAPEFFGRDRKGLVERVCDTIDIAHLRSLARGVDDRYYSRNLELSQNVFRNIDNSKQGIFQCQTPKGFPWLTTQGRRILGIESLMLQGLPVDSLDLSRLDQNNLQDLAGNAMSATVVGACILAALIIFKDVFSSASFEVPIEKTKEVTPCGGDHLLLRSSSATAYTRLSVDTAVSGANLSRRFCKCEGEELIKPVKFMQCRDCGHRACTSCGQMPKHNYDPVDAKLVDNRDNPVKFRALLKRSLPMEISSVGGVVTDVSELLSKFFADNKNDINMETWEMISDRVENALSSKVVLKNIKRREAWEVSYESNHATMVLTISDTNVSWEMFANVSKYGLATQLGKYLRTHPIARMTPFGNDICSGTWLLYRPNERAFHALLSLSGEMKKTYLNHVGLSSAADMYDFEDMAIAIHDFDIQYFGADIRRLWKLKPNCGQPMNTCRAQEGSNLLSFLMYPDNGGDPLCDHFIGFTDDARRLGRGLNRNIIAHFETGFRIPAAERVVVDAVKEIYEYKLVESDDKLNKKIIAKTVADRQKSSKPERVTYTKSNEPFKVGLTQQTHTQIISDGSWADFDFLGINVHHEKEITYHHLSTEVQPLTSDDCSAQMAVLKCQAQINHTTSRKWPQDQLVKIDNEKAADFGKDFGWALERGLVLDGHKELGTDWVSPIPSSPVARCVVCAPAEPTLFWTFDGEKKQKQKPCENPETAAAFERALKSRPDITQLFLRIDSGSQATIFFSINPQTLMHRAAARLVVDEGGSDVKLSWRMVTDAGEHSRPPTQKLMMTSSKSSLAAGQPPGWSLSPGLALRPEQLRAVYWAEKQEESPEPFTQEEVVEARVDVLGYRAEGRATQDIIVRGGILGFDVGFGKTIVILALHQKQLPKAAEFAANAKIPGSIAIKATLILVPSHLPDQWGSEARKFINSKKLNVLVIKTILKLKNCKVKQFKEADIIIMNSGLLESIPYNRALALFAGMVEIDDNAIPRAKYLWREKAAEQARHNVNRLVQDPDNFVGRLEECYAGNLENAASLQPPVPSKRVVGAKYVSKSERDKPVHKRKRAPTAAEDRSAYFKSLENKPLDEFPAFLEMFSFYRMVVDEYTYLNDIARNVNFIKSHCRWTLSGTPGLGSFDAVKALAKLLGINLGIADLSFMTREAAAAFTSGFTSVEKFLSYGERPSYVWDHRRYLLCQSFLDQFLRFDTADIGDVDTDYRILLVHQPRFEWAMYKELEQRTTAMDFEITEASRKSSSDIDQQNRAGLMSCKDGREALICRASHPRALEPASIQATSDANTACEAILDLRMKQAESLEKDLQSQLKLAEWLQRNQPANHPNPTRNFNDWITRLSNNAYGDKEATIIMVRFVKEAKANYHHGDWRQFYRDRTDPEKDPTLPFKPVGMVEIGNNTHLYQVQSELRYLVTVLAQQATTYVKHLRSTRFLKSVGYNDAKDFAQCNVTGCENIIRGDSYCLLMQCGHVICNIKPGCKIPQDGTCPVCKCINRPHEVIEGSTIAKKQDLAVMNAHGEKLQAVTNFIHNIEDEKTIIFVQFEQLRKKVIEALQTGNITYLDLAACSKKSDMLMAYQNGTLVPDSHCTGQMNDCQVLILDINDASASGGNLTVANNIVFISPYYTKGSAAQERYDATMTQAIGRARRYGQRKTVKVVRYIATETIDVDILEFRENKWLVGMENDTESSELSGPLREAQLIEPSLHPSATSSPYHSAVHKLLFRGKAFEK